MVPFEVFSDHSHHSLIVYVAYLELLGIVCHCDSELNPLLPQSLFEALRHRLEPHEWHIRVICALEEVLFWALTPTNAALRSRLQRIWHILWFLWMVRQGGLLIKRLLVRHLVLLLLDCRLVELINDRFEHLITAAYISDCILDQQTRQVPT